MGKIHEAYEMMSSTTITQKTRSLSVECLGGDHFGSRKPRFSVTQRSSDCRSTLPRDRWEWYKGVQRSTKTEILDCSVSRGQVPDWMWEETLTKSHFYRHLLSAGWTLVLREDYGFMAGQWDVEDHCNTPTDAWVWLCPDCLRIQKETGGDRCTGGM